MTSFALERVDTFSGESARQDGPEAAAAQPEYALGASLLALRSTRRRPKKSGDAGASIPNA